MSGPGWAVDQHRWPRSKAGTIRVSRVSPDREVFSDDDLDEDGRSVELLTWQEPAPDDFGHPYEAAQYVSFGSRQTPTATRHARRWATREVRVA